MDLTDKVLVKAMQKRIGAALRNLRDRTRVRSIEETGLWLQWEVVRQIG